MTDEQWDAHLKLTFALHSQMMMHVASMHKMPSKNIRAKIMQTVAGVMMAQLPNHLIPEWLLANAVPEP